jgi:hypothetical protein
VHYRTAFSSPRRTHSTMLPRLLRVQKLLPRSPNSPRVSLSSAADADAVCGARYRACSAQFLSELDEGWTLMPLLVIDVRARVGSRSVPMIRP